MAYHGKSVTNKSRKAPAKSSSLVAGGSSQNHEEPASFCVACANCIVESGDGVSGDEALECDTCHGWVHRRCAALSVKQYTSFLKVTTLSFVHFVCKRA